MTHPNDMTADQLRELVGQMAEAALDLAQHLDMTERGLEPEYQPEARGKAIAMAYGLATYPYNLAAGDLNRSEPGVDAAIFGAGGLERQRLPYSTIARRLNGVEADIELDESYVPTRSARHEDHEIAQRLGEPSPQAPSR